MVKRTLTVLFFLSLLGGCAQTPEQPPVTLDELQDVINTSEQRLTADLTRQLAPQCEPALSEQAVLLAQLDTRQQKVDQALAQLSQTIARQQAAPQKTTSQRCTITGNQLLDGKMLLGTVEWLWIENTNRVFSARVDTGATTSSLSAQDIVLFERDGERWVRFQFQDDNFEGVEMEAKLVRHARIRQSSTDDLDRRPVVRLTVRLGDLTEEAQFTLTDRSNLTYPILLGREFLKDIAVVDVARQNVQPKPEIATQLANGKKLKE